MAYTATKIKAWYKRYNALYFDNKLPDISCIVDSRQCGKHTIATTVFLGEKPSAVYVHRCFFKLPSCFQHLVLLHEMCHVSIIGHAHNEQFQNEMLRLAIAGAFRNLW